MVILTMMFVESRLLVQLPDIVELPSGVIFKRECTNEMAFRTISRMISIPMDNTRLCCPAEWSMDAGSPEATAGRSDCNPAETR